AGAVGSNPITPTNIQSHERAPEGLETAAGCPRRKPKFLPGPVTVGSSTSCESTVDADRAIRHSQSVALVYCCAALPSLCISDLIKSENSAGDSLGLISMPRASIASTTPGSDIAYTIA